MTLRRHFLRDVAAAGVPSRPNEDRVVTAAELEVLPPVVRRYFSAMRVVGRPRVWSFTTRFDGRFRLGADKPWLPATAWQYNVASPVTRVYTMRLRFAGVVPMIGHDTYVAGRGRMLGKVLALKTVADGHGEPYDIGELTTYLNDAVGLAPSMLLADTVTFEQIDERCFDVSLADAGRTVTGRVFLGEHGLPMDFSSRDRFVEVGGRLLRCEWRTPIDNWDLSGEQPMPGLGHATWLLPDGPLVYAEGRFSARAMRTNVAPEAL